MEYPLTYVYLAATLAMVSVTTIVALVGRSGVLKNSLVALTGAITLWNLTELLSNLAPTVDALAVVARVATFAWGPVPALILVSVLAYTGQRHWLRPPRLILLAVPALVCMGLALGGGMRAELFVATDDVPYFHSNVTGWYHLVSLYVLGYLVAAAVVLVVAARRSHRPEVARSARLMLLGTVPAGAIAVAANGLLAMRGLSTPHLGAVATALVAVFLAVGIARRRLFVESALSEERYRVLLDTSPDPVIVIARDEGVVAANQPAVELFGFDDVNEALALHDPLVVVTDNDRERVAGFLKRALLGERFVGVEIEVDNQKTGPRLVDVSSGPVFDPRGQAVGLVVAGRDITERRRDEEERHALAEQVQQTQKLESLGVLAGGVAHDFNNLLVGILGNAGLARLNAPGNTEVQERVAQIESAAERAAALAQQMLTYTGRATGELVAVDLAEEVTEMTELLRVSMSSTIAVGYELSPSLPRVRGDPVQLQQVVMNLITNASEAIGETDGRITIRMRMESVAAGEVVEAGSGQPLPAGDYVCLEVGDTGCGIAPDELARVFEPFYTTKFTGRGLGLASVLGIARAHHGAVSLDSEPGRGTTVRVYLPATDSSERVGPEVVAAPEELRGSGTVLVVDDEEIVRDVARGILDQAGFEVVEACDGEEAVAAVSSSNGELRAVLLDVAMPRMGGAEAVKRIRELSPELPIILMSGYTEDQLSDTLGCPFLAKPFGPEALLDAFRDLE